MVVSRLAQDELAQRSVRVDLERLSLEDGLPSRTALLRGLEVRDVLVSTCPKFHSYIGGQWAPLT